MFLDNLLPSYLGGFAAPASLLKRLQYPHLVSYGLLANLKLMKCKSIIKGIDSIWDVGANIGQFAYMANSVWPELPIYSFEPTPECYQRLDENFNKFHIPGYAYNIGLGEKEGRLELSQYANEVNNSFLPRLFDSLEVRNKISVDCSTLDRISSEFPESKSPFLKLDVQGFELEVLAGATDFLKKCHYVLAEVAFSPAYKGGAYADEVMQVMRLNGFKSIQILDVLRDAESGYIIEADILFMNTQVIVE